MKKNELHALQGVAEMIAPYIQDGVKMASDQLEYVIEERIPNINTMKEKIEFLMNCVRDVNSKPVWQTLGNVVATCYCLMEELEITNPMEEIKKEVAYDLIFDGGIFHHRDKSDEEKYYALLERFGIAAGVIKEPISTSRGLAALGGGALTWLTLHLLEDHDN